MGFEVRALPPVEMLISPILWIALSSRSVENTPVLMASRLTGRLASTRDHSESGKGGGDPDPLNLRPLGMIEVEGVNPGELSRLSAVISERDTVKELGCG